MQVVKRYN